MDLDHFPPSGVFAECNQQTPAPPLELPYKYSSLLFNPKVLKAQLFLAFDDNSITREEI